MPFSVPLHKNDIGIYVGDAFTIQQLTGGNFMVRIQIAE